MCYGSFFAQSLVRAGVCVRARYASLLSLILSLSFSLSLSVYLALRCRLYAASFGGPEESRGKFLAAGGGEGANEVKVSETDAEHYCESLFDIMYKGYPVRSWGFVGRFGIHLKVIECARGGIEFDDHGGDTVLL